MQGTARGMSRTELRDLLTEASRALEAFDADRLEELALSCQALNHNLPEVHMYIVSMSPDEARIAYRSLATFGRVLEITHSNLDVMRQIGASEAGMLEYTEPSNRCAEGDLPHGND